MNPAGTRTARGTLYAMISGERRGSDVTFSKTYDGTGGWDHAIDYDGTINGDATEIDGVWTIPGQWAGRFLMVRIGNATEAVKRTAAAKV